VTAYEKDQGYMEWVFKPRNRSQAFNSGLLRAFWPVWTTNDLANGWNQVMTLSANGTMTI